MQIASFYHEHPLFCFQEHLRNVKGQHITHARDITDSSVRQNHLMLSYSGCIQIFHS